MQRSLFGFVRAYSWPQQLAILALTLTSLPFFYLWVELPKRIVDDALGGPPGPRDFFGIELARLDYLLALCFVFLALVIVNGVFKYVINVYKGVVGERMLRRLRYELYHRILRFPPSHFRVVSQGQLVQMVNAEVEPLGGFIGDAYAVPAYQGGMLLTILAFMFVQNPFMGLAAVVLYPLQIAVIPPLQRQVNELGKQRVRQVRVLAERIGESASGVDDIRANDATAYERARFADELGRVFFIRLGIYRKKFFIKFLNNFLSQLAPFLFYSIGGYLVLQGQLTIGAILAIVAAHEKLTSPWKELLTYYQMMWDSQIKYEQVVNQFDPPALRPRHAQEAPPPADLELTGRLAASGLYVGEDEAEGGLKGARFALDLPAHVALLGGHAGGHSELLRAMVGLAPVQSGSLTINDREITKLPESVTGRRFAYVGNPAHVFAGSLRHNLVYGLKHHPRPAEEGGRGPREDAEAKASANSPHDSAGDWIDYAEIGVSHAEALDDRLLEVLETVRLSRDVYVLGLRGRVQPERAPAVAKRILAARHRLAERLAADARLARLVEPFDPARYNDNATVAENLLFGAPLDPVWSTDRLAANSLVRKVLAELDLDAELRRIGWQLAATMVELFADLPPDHEYFRRFSFIGADDLPEYRELIGRVDADEAARLADGPDAERLLALTMQLIPARHRLGLVEDALQERLVQARHRLRQRMSEADRARIAFFEPEAFNRGASLQDNILFGRIALDQANAEHIVLEEIAGVIDELGLRRLIVQVGLDSEVGLGGIRLGLQLRQKLALGRALVRRPDWLLLDDSLALFERAEQERLRDRLLEASRGRTVLWVHTRPEWTDAFDRVLVFEGGQVTAAGTPGEVSARKGDLATVAAGA
ncbi:MAG: ABC transporter ATP-binding protein [Alphaproteobacteria bacterium]|jgi:ABC-type multidrug transport system fused ATPase/permease subunit|nr:ABC transporter ATP-binding protein [Alphaproteobacteria bacterium]